MKYWIKEFINQIKDNNDIYASCNCKENLQENIVSNNSSQIANDETMPLLQEHTPNNNCTVIDIEPNISVVNNIVKIDSKEKQPEQKKQTISKSSNYGSIL